MVAESLAVTARRQIFAEAQMILVDAAGVEGRAAVESRKIGQHAPEPGTHDVRRLAEQAEEVGAGVFDLRVVKGDREGHVGGLRLDVKRLQQFDEIGICSRIEDDEARVDRNLTLRNGRENRIRMSADPIRLLVDDDVVAPGEQPCGGEAGHAGPHHGDAKSRS